MIALLVAVSLLAPIAQPPSTADAPSVLYFVSESTAVHAEPALRSATTGKLRPFDIVTGRPLNDWLLIETSSTGLECGWIPLVAENVIHVPIDALKRRVFHARETRWPDRVKLDVARGQVRKGFTADQVKLALGDPTAKELVRAGESVTETWTYLDRRIAFSHTGVSTIERLEPRR